MNELLTLWAVGLGIPLEVFKDPRVTESIKAKDGHGCQSDMVRWITTNFKPEYREGLNNLSNPKYRLELCFLLR